MKQGPARQDRDKCIADFNISWSLNQMETNKRMWGKAATAAILLIVAQEGAIARAEDPSGQLPQITYADLVDLADSAPLVLRAKLRRLIRVENERSPGLRPGMGRFYIEAETQALLAGDGALGESLVYLADLPLDARGKPPKLKKQDVLLFARPVPGRPGELQLVAPDAQLLWAEETETRLRSILSELVGLDAPGRVTGVREIIHVPGPLAGEGETQIFLATADGSAASLSVSHRPGRPPKWGASFTELVANVDDPPVRDSLVWYRLACFLPNSLPRGANLSETPRSRSQAIADYNMVLGDLGTCERRRR
jgi:hypothetical protein